MGITPAMAAMIAAGVAGSAGMAMGTAMGQSGAGPPTPPPKPDEVNENKAQKEAEKRRRLYAGIGRSSTILTGPSGLGAAPVAADTATPKQLLGL